MYHMLFSAEERALTRPFRLPKAGTELLERSRFSCEAHKKISLRKELPTER
jgi:hypothetical protein